MSENRSDTYVNLLLQRNQELRKFLNYSSNLDYYIKKVRQEAAEDPHAWLARTIQSFTAALEKKKGPS